MLNASPLRVAVLCSRRAPGLVHLLTRAERPGVDWNIVCCLTSEDRFAEQAEVERHGVPVIAHPVRRFYAERRPGARLADLHLREDYDVRTVELLQAYRPDVVILAGYLLLLTGPMLRAFDGRIVNVHHSDLALRDAGGGPRYPGLRAVRDAILAGEPDTRSTVHVVTERLDDGPPLLVSRPFPVSDVAAWARAAGEDDVLRRAIWVHQEWMLRAAFGPLLEQMLDMLAGPNQGDTPAAAGETAP
jgi:folate-dependent phosphoribosylglycinamide formyltransferase PurN